MRTAPSRIVGGWALRLLRRPLVKRWVWRWVYEGLARWVRIPGWRLMNFGYAASDAPVALDPVDEAERSAFQLYAEVAAAVPLAGRDVLEVGSGRGGGAAWVHRACGCASVTGVDLAPTAVAIAGRTASPGLRFVQGDAECLPFADASFDVVLSVESSHAYPSPERFLREVHRVLRPGGALVLADVRPVEAVARFEATLADAGLPVRASRDITAHVLRAIDEDDAEKRRRVGARLPAMLVGLFMEFAGGRGSAIDARLRGGASVYRIWRAERVAG